MTKDRRKAVAPLAYELELHRVTTFTKAERDALSRIIGFREEDVGRVYKGGTTFWQIKAITVGEFRAYDRQLLSDLIGADMTASVLAKVGAPETRGQLAQRHYMKG